MEEKTETVLMESMHLHLQAIARRPLDAQMLVELEKTCMLARQLLVMSRAPNAIEKANMFGPQMPMPTYIGDVSGSVAQYASPAPNNSMETFGVQAIKELINLLPGVLKPPSAPIIEPAPELNYAQLAMAMQTAQEAGDDKLYDELLERLRTDQKRADLMNQKLQKSLSSSQPEEPLEGEAA